VAGPEALFGAVQGDQINEWFFPLVRGCEALVSRRVPVGAVDLDVIFRQCVDVRDDFIPSRNCKVASRAKSDLDVYFEEGCFAHKTGKSGVCFLSVWVLLGVSRFQL